MLHELDDLIAFRAPKPAPLTTATMSKFCFVWLVCWV